MNELSLFTGAGGGLLGSKLLGWRTVGYVEWEKYCQKVIAQRIEDGFLDEAPIFGDINEFVQSGAAKKYAGFVDVVTGGFPCQPFSVAGKQKGKDDQRNQWPATLQCIRDIRPRYALLENVPGLLNSGYFPEILGSLAEAGYDARWLVLGADDVHAPHRRKRLWILAYPKHTGRSSTEVTGSIAQRGDSGSSGSQSTCQPAGRGEQYAQLADTDSAGLQQGNEEMAGRSPEQSDRSSLQPGQDVANTIGEYERMHTPGSGSCGTQHGGQERHEVGSESSGYSQSSNLPYPNDTGLEGRIQDGESYAEGREVQSDRRTPQCDLGWEGSGDFWWASEPDVGRVVNGLANRVDRLKSLGNGQVPAVAAVAWNILFQSLRRG